MMKVQLSLLFFIGVASWGNWYLWNTELDISPISVRQITQVPEVTFEEAVEASVPEIGVFEAYERPLFSPNRRPPPALVEEVTTLPDIIDDAPLMVASAEPSNLENVQVLGIQRAPDHSRALLRTETGGTPEWYEVTDIVAGWTLNDIGDSYLTFVREGQVARANLYPESELSDEDAGDTD